MLRLINEYNNISRGTISKKEKNATLARFEHFLSAYPELGAKTLACMIGFKNQRKNGHQEAQDLHLNQLFNNWHTITDQSLNYTKIIRLIRNRKSLFKAALPGRIRNYLNKLISSNDKILPQLLYLLTNSDLEFLEANGVMVSELKANALRRVFKRLELAFHPDKNPNDKVAASLCRNLHNLRADWEKHKSRIGGIVYAINELLPCFKHYQLVAEPWQLVLMILNNSFKSHDASILGLEG
jgi:hypothetical protein